MAAGNKASAFRADTASTVVPTHPPSTASSTAALGPETLDVAIRGIANEKTPGLEHSLGLKRATTGKSCRSVAIGKTHEHPITDISVGRDLGRRNEVVGSGDSVGRERGPKLRPKVGTCVHT